MTSENENRQEDDTLPAGKVLLALFGILAISLLMVLASFLIQRGSEESLNPSGVWRDQRLGAPHRVAGVREMMFSESKTAAERNDRNRQLLETYGWVDRPKGLVRIPIDRAMELVVEAPR